MNQHAPSRSDVTVVITAMTDPERPWVMEAIDSVLGQSVKPDAVIVLVELNNAWIDEELRRSAHPAVRDQLIRLHRIPLARLGSVRNTGTQLSETKWVAFLDGDDVWAPRKLQRQLEAARKRPDALFIATDFIFIDEKSRPFGYSNGSNPTPSSWLVDRALLLGHPFGPDTKVGEDFFWLRETRAVCPRVRVPEVLVSYRIRRSSISSLGNGHTLQRRLRELAARATGLRAVRYPLLAATYVRYAANRGTEYEV